MVCGVVVAGLEAIEAGFGVVVVAAIAEGIDACHSAGAADDIAPCVIGVACDRHILKAGDIGDQLDYIALQVLCN